MSSYLGYDRAMQYGKLSFAVVVFALLVPSVLAQANGVPPSVTSFGFGGHSGFNGVPPSVTSLGPQGAGVPHRGPHQPQFTSNPGHNHHRGNDNSHYVPYYVPYYIPYYPYADSYDGPLDPSADQAADEPEQYRGGPTIFDRRGSGTPPTSDYQPSARNSAPVPRPASQTADARQSPVQSASAAGEEVLATKAEEPAASPVVSAQPATVLIFKDGRRLEVGNYAIVGTYLFDLTPGHRMKIDLSDLDLPATQKANDDEGIDFTLPHSPDGN